MLISMLEKINGLYESLFVPVDTLVEKLPMADWAVDAVCDSIHLLPFLFIVFVIIEILEFYHADRINTLLKKSGKSGVLVGAIASIIPQCGFSVIASSLYSNRIITRGCLIAVYLATSDETIPILLATPAKVYLIIPIVGIKLFIGILMGYLIDFLAPQRIIREDTNEIDIVEEGCCKHDIEHGSKRELIIHPILHTTNVFAFILVITLILNYFLTNVDVDSLIGGSKFLQPVIASFVGLIPNCAVSIGLTMMLIKGTISFGAVMSGLLSNAGLGLLVLLKNNDFKDTMKIIFILLLISIISGMMINIVFWYQLANYFFTGFYRYMNILSTPQYSFKYNNQPNFQGNSRNLQTSVDKALRKSSLTDGDLLELSTRIKKAVKDVVTPEKFIEEGSHNAVYKITRKYAARVPVGEKIDAKDLPEKPTFGQAIFKDLHNYFGEAIVKLGKFQILKNVGKHVPAGVPEHYTKTFTKGSINKYYREKYLPHFARITQASYNELAKDIAKLNEIKLGPRSYCLFDSINPNNIVARAGKLYLVDEIDTLYDKSYGNTTAKLFEVFINKATKDYEAPDAGDKRKYVRNIFKKIVIAADNANLLHADSKEDYANWEKALKKCKFNIPASEILNKLDRLQYEVKDQNQRTTLIKNYLNKLCIDNPM